MRERAIVVAALCATLSFTERASAEVVPLAALEQRAVARHSALAASAAKTRAAAAEVRQAESAYKPRIGLNASTDVGPGRTLVYVNEVDENGNPLEKQTKPVLVQGARPLGAGSSAFKPQLRTGVDLALGASLYDFGRTRAAIAASRARHRATSAEAAMTRAEIVAGVRGAYLAWLSAYQLHQLSTGTSADAGRRSERATALIEEGARPRGDLAPVEADRLLSELEQERASGDLDAARMLLEQNVGEPLATSAEPDGAVLDVQLDPNVVREADASLRVLAHQRAALEATARMQRRANRPILSTELGVGVHAQTRTLDSWRAFPTYAAGLALAVPLWDGGSARAAADAADARADEVRIRLESAERQRAQEIARAQRDVAHAEKRAEVAARLLEVCKARITDVEAGYELGAMQFEQVQQAHALLRRAETELVMAKVARAEAVLRVTP